MIGKLQYERGEDEDARENEREKTVTGAKRQPNLHMSLTIVKSDFGTRLIKKVMTA